MGYVFFDTETTGLAKGFDQIIHFAAIRTDHDLNETGRFEARSRLQPHVIPHPGAIRTNGLPIARLIDPDLPSHYEMVCAVRRQLLAWSPAIFAGFNSIGFDEHMLRHALFQSLHPAYLTSNHQNARTDVLSLILAACALSPGCLVVPTGPNERPTFKLDQIAPANGIPHARAHDAMADAMAVVELCRLVKQRSSEVWGRFARFANKAVVAEFVDHQDGFILSEFYGPEAYHTPVVCIGGAPNDANARFCVSLALDPESLRGIADEALRAEFARKGSPIRRLRVNGAPTLSDLYDAPGHLLNGVDAAVAEERARRFKGDAALCRRLIGLYTEAWKDDADSPHPELRLYSGGFPNRDDEGRTFEFHKASWARRTEIVAEFEDQRLKAFGQRLIYGQHRALLDEAARREADLDLADRLMEERGGALTLPGALAATEALLADDFGDPNGLLADYRDYLVSRTAKVTEFRERCAGGPVST